MLERFADTLADHFDVSDVLYGLSQHTVEVLGASCAGVSLIDENSGSLNFVSSSSDRAAELELVQQQTQEGPCYQAFESAKPSVVHDVTDHDAWPHYRAKAQALGLAAVAGIPMTINDRRLGALNIYSDRPRVWSDADIHVAHVLANIATSYVLHASQFAEIQRVNEQLQHALTSRVMIEQAKGLLAGELGISLDQSFEMLRRHARTNQAKLHEVAEAVVNLGLRPKPTEPPSP